MWPAYYVISLAVVVVVVVYFDFIASPFSIVKKIGYEHNQSKAG